MFRFSKKEITETSVIYRTRKLKKKFYRLQKFPKFRKLEVMEITEFFEVTELSEVSVTKFPFF